jgi:hypothetical protein
VEKAPGWSIERSHGILNTEAQSNEETGEDFGSVFFLYLCTYV